MKKREVGLYAAVWALVFTLASIGYSWRDIFQNWLGMLPFLLLFLLHHFLAAPFLDRKRWKAYLATAIPLLSLFVAYCFQTADAPPPPPMDDFRPVPPGGPHHLHPAVLKVIIGLLVMLVNLGTKAFFRNLRSERRVRELAEQAALPEVLHFKTEHKTVAVPLDSIRYIESMSEYVKIWLDTQEAPLVVLYSLKKLVSELPESRFMRIHRSYIVSLSRIREANASTVALDQNITLPVGESYRPAFRAWLAHLNN